MNLQLGWDSVGTAHLGSTYYPLGVAQRQALMPGYWLRPYLSFIGYCGPENTQVAPQMAWAFSHRVAGLQGSLRKEVNPT